jgi:hypothetical protein
MNVSLTPELKLFINRRLRSGLRAFSREEMAAAHQAWHKIAADLPREPITRRIQSRIERTIRAEHRAKSGAAGRTGSPKKGR